MPYTPTADDVRCANCQEWYHRALRNCPMCDAPNVPRQAPPPPQYQAPPRQAPPPPQYQAPQQQYQAPPVQQAQPPVHRAPAVADINNDKDERVGKTMFIAGLIGMMSICLKAISAAPGATEEVGGIFLTWLVLCALVGRAAYVRGLSYSWGMGMAALFSPIVGAIAVGMRPKDQDELQYRKLISGEGKKCPHCAEIIKPEAVVCRYCGRAIH